MGDAGKVLRGIADGGISMTGDALDVDMGWWKSIDLVGSAVEGGAQGTVNLIKGDDELFKHDDWGFGGDDPVGWNEQMRAWTEGTNYKKWDKYYADQAKKRQEALEKLKALNATKVKGQDYTSPPYRDTGNDASGKSNAGKTGAVDPYSIDDISLLTG
jgi:hypothetical protein